MYVTIRRYEGVDEDRLEEVAHEVTESLVPSLEALPGFSGYYLIDAGAGVLTSVTIFETPEQAHESTRVAARWIRERNLAAALPNSPTITAGPVVASGSRAPLALSGLAAHF
jgi:hypothetical protein